MCEAWAQDIIDASFAELVSDSLQRYLEVYAAIPEHLRSLSNTQIGEVRSAITEAVMGEYSAAVTTGFSLVAGIVNVVPVAGQIASALIALVGGLVVGLLAILQEADALGFGGGEFEAACIPPPVLRQIPRIGQDACNFDPRDGRAQTVANQVSAVNEAATRDLPIGTWIKASGIAAGDDVPLDDGLNEDRDLEDDGDGLNPLLIAGGVGALGLLAYFALRRE